MVVTGDHQHAAMRRGAVGITVLERISGAVDPGALPVPETEYAIDLARGLRFHLLGAQHRGGGKVLIHRRHEADAEVIAEFLAAPEFEIDASERRATIARDETGGFQTSGTVAPCLVERNPHDRLRAGQKNTAMLPCVAIRQGVRVEVSCVGCEFWCHGKPPRPCSVNARCAVSGTTRGRNVRFSLRRA
jgi:hypothetical protein